MEEMGAKFDSLADSLDDPVASLDEAAPREGAGLPALDRLERSPGGSSPGSPAAYRSQEGASKGVAAGRRWSEGGSREAHGRGKGQGQEDEEGPWEGGEGGGTPEAEGTPDAGTPTFGTSDGGVPGGDGTPPQSGFGAAGSFPASSSLSQFNGAPASSLHDRRPLLFGPGGRSARFPQMARSSSKVLAAESIPTWKPGGQKNMTIRVLQRKTVWEKALNTYSWVLKVLHWYCTVHVLYRYYHYTRVCSRQCTLLPLYRDRWAAIVSRRGEGILYTCHCSNLTRIHPTPSPSLPPVSQRVILYCIRIQPTTTDTASQRVACAAEFGPLCAVGRVRPRPAGGPLHAPLPGQVARVRAARRLRRRLDQPGDARAQPRGGVLHERVRGVPGHDAARGPRPARLHLRVSVGATV